MRRKPTDDIANWRLQQENTSKSFPYYAPIRRNNLKEKECLRNIEGRHIKYAKLKFCPLIIPSVCPECRCKFFEMDDDLQNAGKN